MIINIEENKNENMVKLVFILKGNFFMYKGLLFVKISNQGVDTHTCYCIIKKLLTELPLDAMVSPCSRVDIMYQI